MTKWLELWVTVMVVAGTIPAVGYPLAWGLRGTWRGTPVGRALMFHAASLAALFVVSVANLVLPGAWFLYVYTLTVTAVVVALFYQFGVLLSEQRKERKARERAQRDT